MAFKIAQKRTIWWPVTVSIPQDGGNTTKAVFEAQFEVLSQEVLDKIPASGADLLDLVLQDWRKVSDDKDEELACTAENKKTFLGITYVRNALYTAYAEVQTGRAAARKN